MAEPEKVIKGLECLISNEVPCKGCPYYGSGYCLRNIAKDAMALLKEQEAVKPEAEVLNETDRIYRCPKCHKCLFYTKQRFCDQCGQEVKWE